MKTNNHPQITLSYGVSEWGEDGIFKKKILYFSSSVKLVGFCCKVQRRTLMKPRRFVRLSFPEDAEEYDQEGLEIESADAITQLY